MVTADDVSQGKPAPDLCKTATRGIGLFHPCVEDSGQVPLGQAAGLLPAHAVTLGIELGPMFDQAAAVFDHLGDVSHPCINVRAPLAPEAR